MTRIIFWFNIVLMSMVCLCSCGEKSSEMGPVETVEAESLCDITTMKDYISTCQDAFEKMREQDNAVMAIAVGIIAGSEITVNDSRKVEDKRVVTYTLTTGEYSKTLKATLRKEEGEWRVEKIEDVN